MQGKFLTEKDINNFYLRYKNLTPIIRCLVEDGIKHDPKDRNKVQHSGTVEKAIGPGSATSLINGEQVTIKKFPKNNGKLYFDHGLGVKGMNVIDNRIYIAASPELVKSDYVVKREFLPKNFCPEAPTPPNALPVQNLLTVEAEALRKKFEAEALENLQFLAKLHLQEMFETIADRSKKDNQPLKSVTCVIVRDSTTNENIWLYTDKNDNSESRGALANDSNIVYQESNLAKFNTSFDINSYFLHSANKEIDLTSQGLDILYQIYKNTIGKNEPILLYSTHGLDRAPIVALAFYLLKNFDSIFLKTDGSDKINAEVLKAFQTFRVAHSPEVLTNVLDIKQAFYIAFSLKVIEIEKQIMEDIDAFIHFVGDNSVFTPKAQILQTMINAIKAAPTYAGKHVLVKSLLAKHTLELKDSGVPITAFFTNFDQFKQKIGEPRHYTLAKMLYEVLAARASIEEKTLLICKKGDHPAYASVKGVAEEEAPKPAAAI